MYVSRVLDMQLLERLMSPSLKSQVMFASAFSRIGDFFSSFYDSHFLSYGEFVELINMQNAATATASVYKTI